MPTAPVPRQIGPYHILEELGRGGMGVVYRAEQKEPVRRYVALKVVQSGRGTKEVLARFQLERRALAAMSHRCIAKVFDAGATEQGEPYFVMEIVEGLPLTTYCDRHKLSLADRVKLFQQVCDGVQHAHLKGIVHRDLKPSNVLVVREGDAAVPKILDFGLAKATNRGLVDITVFTEADRILGTPEYMSPEQAGGDGEAIDARADIYSLGVMLYELLCGELPFPTEMLRHAGQLGAIRLIQEQEPPKPSTKLATRHDSALLAEQRRTSTVALRNALAGDLDWVVLKAMAKEPERRYDAATALAADLGRYLEHQPVLAGPPGLGYRMRKLVRRNRALVTGTLAVLLVMAAGTITSWLLYADAREQERIANGATILANDRATQMTKLAQEKGQALDRFNLLADIVNLRELKAAEEALYPGFPEQVPAMEGWLGKARVLVSRSGKVRSARDEVLASSLALLPATSQATSTASSSSQPTASHVAVRLPEEHPNRFLLETLDRLANGLEVFGQDEVRSVERRCLEAKEIRKLSIEDHQSEWDAAIAAIAKEPKYGGLRIRPQIGLVPIGADRDSKLWEFAHLPSGEIGRRRTRDNRLIVKHETGIVFVLLPAGEFWMGAQKEGQNADPRALKPESPIKQVKLSAFFVGKHELTQGQWVRLTRAENPSVGAQARGVTLAHPVELVDWEMCNTWLTRHGLCLPTEAQWEYGCRAGTTTPWWPGEDRESLRTPRLVANLADQAAKRAGAQWLDIADWPDLDDGHALHAPVGSFAPNAFGLHDVHGNVWEWCRDWYLPYSAPTNPRDGLRLGDPSGHRVFRGGSFDGGARSARAAHRDLGPPTVRRYVLGARASRVITE